MMLDGLDRRPPTHKMTPSQRAAADAEKIRIREEKRRGEGGIGPGSYEPKRVPSSKTNLCGSSSFRSTTPRTTNRVAGADSMLRDITLNTDPAAYDPDEGKNLKATAGKFFHNKQNASGHGSFGSLSARRMKSDIMGEDTPCPTSYGSEHLKGLAARANSMKTASFHSKSDQRPKAKVDPHIPPLGTYDPDFAGVSPYVRNGGAMFKSQINRSKPIGFTHAGQEASTDILVGPNSYMPDFAINGGRSTIAGKARRSASFGRSTAFRKSGVRDLSARYFANEPYF